MRSLFRQPEHYSGSLKASLPNVIQHFEMVCSSHLLTKPYHGKRGRIRTYEVFSDHTCTQVQTQRFTVPCFGRLLTLLFINTCTSFPFSNFDSVQLKMQVAHMMIAFIYFRHVAWIAPAPIPLPFMQVGAVNVVPSLLKAFLHFLPYFLNRSDSYTTHLLYKSTLLFSTRPLCERPRRNHR